MLSQAAEHPVILLSCQGQDHTKLARSIVVQVKSGMLHVKACPAKQPPRDQGALLCSLRGKDAGWEGLSGEPGRLDWWTSLGRKNGDYDYKFFENVK